MSLAQLSDTLVIFSEVSCTSGGTRRFGVRFAEAAIKRLCQSGCCGMAGSFGYEKEHEAIAMHIGELHLFPTVRESTPEDVIIASGVSCRQLIHDGTGRQALHLAQATNDF